MKSKTRILASCLIAFIYFTSCYLYVKGDVVATQTEPQTPSSTGMATFSTEATISVKVTRTPLSFLEHEVFFTDQMGAYHAIFLGLLFSLNLVLSLSKVTVTMSDTPEQASKPLINNIKGGKEQK